MNDHRPDAAGPGLADAELIRYLDGELDALGRARVERRIADDPAAARRLETLRRRGRRMRELLAAADAPALGNGRSPHGPEFPAESAGAADARPAPVIPLNARAPGRETGTAGRRRFLRAAVVLLALAATALLAPPVRALIAEGLARLAAAFGEEPAVPAATGTAPTADGSAGARDAEFGAAFDVAAAEFRIEVATGQAAGTLTVRPGAGERGSAAIDGPAGQAELVVSDGVLRIRNGEDATASYVVALPATVRRVHIQVGGQETVALPLDREHRIELTRR